MIKLTIHKVGIENNPLPDNIDIAFHKSMGIETIGNIYSENGNVILTCCRKEGNKITYNGKIIAEVVF